MKFVIERRDNEQRVVFKGEITAYDLRRLDLDPVDRALLDDRNEMPADVLLVLEMLFRRAAEQNLPIDGSFILRPT